MVIRIIFFIKEVIFIIYFIHTSAFFIIVVYLLMVMGDYWIIVRVVFMVFICQFNFPLLVSYY